MRRKEKIKIAQIKNIYLIPTLVIITVLTFTLNAFALEFAGGGGEFYGGTGGIIEATQPVFENPPTEDFIDWSSNFPKTSSELNPDTIGNYDNMEVDLLNLLPPIDNYINNIFSGIPTQKEINDISRYAYSLQNINSVISNSLSTIETQLDMSYGELSKVINPNRSLVDPPTLLTYNDQLSAAKEKLQTLQNLITTQLENINYNISQLLSDRDTELEKTEGGGENLTQIFKTAQEIHDLINTKPEADVNQTMDINEISNSIEPSNKFSDFLSITDAEIALLRIFPESVRSDLEKIVVDNLNTELDYYQKIIGQLTAFEPNKTVSEIRNTVSSRIEDLNARLNKVNAIDDHPFSFVYTGNEQDPRGIIDKVIKLSNQFNNFENLTDQEKNDLKTSAKFYQDTLKLFILTEPEIQKLQTACDTSNMPYDIALRNLSVSEWDVYTTLKNKLSDFKRFLIGSEYSSKPPLQETIRKSVTALESISLGIETVSANPEQLNSDILEANSKLFSEFLGVPIDVTTIHSAEDLLAQLGAATSDRSAALLKTVDDEIALLQILPMDFRIGFSSWSRYKSMNDYIWNQLREGNPEGLLSKLKDISKTSSLGSIINEAIDILSARVEAFQSKGQTLYELEKIYNEHTSYEETDFILSLDSIVNGDQTLLDLAKGQGGELKSILEQLKLSDTVNIDELNKIGTLLTNYLTYLHEVEDIIPRCSYLEKNEDFKEAFEYLKKLYPDLSSTTIEINNLVSIVESLIDAQSTLHTTATIQNSIESLETQYTQLEERLKTASIVESPKIEKTLMQLYAQRSQLENQFHSLTQKAEDTLKITTIACTFINGDITFFEAQKRIADLQNIGANSTTLPQETNNQAAGTAVTISVQGTGGNGETKTTSSPMTIEEEVEMIKQYARIHEHDETENPPPAATNTTPPQGIDNQAAAGTTPVTISVQGERTEDNPATPSPTPLQETDNPLAAAGTTPSQGDVTIPPTGNGDKPISITLPAVDGTVPTNLPQPRDTNISDPTLTRDESEALAASFATTFDNLLNDDTNLPSTMSDLYSGLSNPDTVSDTLASVFNSPPINQGNHLTDEQTVILSMFGIISLGEDYSNNPVLSSAVHKATQKILNSYDDTLRDILPEQFTAIVRALQIDNFNISKVSEDTGVSEDFITQVVELVKNNPGITSDSQLNADSISAPIGYVAIDEEKGFITFTANKNIQPYNLEKFKNLSDDEITALSKSVNISEEVLRQIRDNISQRNNGVFVMITVDIDGEKVPVLVLADTIVYINSTKPTEVAKEILKHILIHRPNASEALVDRAFLLIVIIGLICIGFGVGLAVYITRLQLKKSDYFNPVLSRKKVYQHNFTPSWKTR